MDERLIDLNEKAKQRIFADLVGVAPQAISSLVQGSILTREQTIGEWLLEYTKHLRKRAAGHVSEEGLDLVQERAALAREQRESAALKNAEMRGELVRAEEIYRELYTLTRTARNGLLTIADRISVEVAAESDHHTVHEMIENEVETVMAEMLETVDELEPDIEPEEVEDDAAG